MATGAGAKLLGVELDTNAIVVGGQRIETPRRITDGVWHHIASRPPTARSPATWTASAPAPPRPS